MDNLKFSYHNRKMHHTADMLGLPHSQVLSLDLPAGWSCPAASICLAKVDQETGLMSKGPAHKFTCYAAKTECFAPNVRRSRWYNFDLLKLALKNGEAERLIMQSIPRTAKIIRVHSSGDFFNPAYFQAWLHIATARPDLTFFGYTKVLNCMLAERPGNFHLVYSFGGTQDSQSVKYNLPTCYVVQDETEADQLGVPLSCTPDSPANDYYYIVNQESFAIKLH